LVQTQKVFSGSTARLSGALPITESRPVNSIPSH
jgi:hypothetical protein